MEAFTTLSAVAAPFYHPDVDTDEIIPHRYLRKPLSAGYGNFLFHDQRYLPDGAENPAFVLNQPAYRGARVLVSGRNFGCGSTREGAVYALLDYGIRCVIAPSFSEIFSGNCVQNALLPIALGEDTVRTLCAQLESQPGARVTIDLSAQTLTLPDCAVCRFDIAPTTKAQLLEGLDEIGLTLKLREEITAFEQRYNARLRWLRRAGPA